MNLARSAARTVHRLRFRWLALRGREAYPPGSVEWLILSEAHYGGYQRAIARRRVSPLDPGGPTGGSGRFEGGDRMSPVRHGYAAKYAEHLAPFAADRERPYTVVEVGILRGMGLALWSDLFPRASVLGFDLDLSYFRENEAFLRSRGAFAAENLRLAEFDQYAADPRSMGELLGGRRIDVLIDDGCHQDQAILNTFDAARPHLAERFVYFIEDNRTVLPALQARHPGLCYDYRNQLTIVTPG